MSTEAVVTTDLEQILRAQQDATRAAGLRAQTRRERIQRSSTFWWQTTKI